MVLNNNIITFYLLIACVFFLGNEINAQGVLKGKVTDGETGEELYGVNYLVYKNNIFLQGGITNEKGNYNIELLTGRYDIEFIYLGYPDKKILNVPIQNKETNIINIEIVLSAVQKMICPDCGNPIQAKALVEIEVHDISREPTREIGEIILSTPGVSFIQ